MDLIVVESPTKAKTLARFLDNTKKVEATMGHIKDLPKSTLGVDVDNNFAPEYVVVKGKEKTIKLIQQASKGAGQVYIATDPDREGEAIASHVFEILTENKNATKSKANSMHIARIAFHEITKEALEEAMNNPRAVDSNLVDAQSARRVLDRLVGYKLSPLLWKKVRRGLSAGRVQSVAVRLIVERAREIEAFKPVEYWDIVVTLKPTSSTHDTDAFSVALIKKDGKKCEIGNKEQADQAVAHLSDSVYKVADVARRQVVKQPYPPFTTSTMTQAGARVFGWSAKRTMSAAQRLYEEGLITYHRTDSVNLSSAAIDKARDYIGHNFGVKYVPSAVRRYKTNSKNAQEAHEAIRPTNVGYKGEGSEGDQRKLYELVWKRFLACQMAASVYDETTIEVEASPKHAQSVYTLRVSGQVMKFDGWRVVWGGRSIDDNEVALPQLTNDEQLDFVSIDPKQKFTQPPAPFNEASLIKTLEKLGIGRPSTYAPIITTIQLRGYVEKSDGKFTPTSVGMAVNDFLIKYFPDTFDYAFTAKMEENLDDVALGKTDWTATLGDFWRPFVAKITKVEEDAPRVKIEVEKLGRQCPQCSEGELVVRTGRFGKFISCSRFPECKYIEKYLDKTGSKCPDCKEGDVIVKKTKRGRKFFGCSRYPACKWASWNKPK